MRLSAILLLFKEEAFIEACVNAIYPVVDSICVTTQYDHNYDGQVLPPDGSIAKLLSLPDPENKIRITINRNLSIFPGDDSEARLRNVAMSLDPKADYYLIVDSDEIWPTQILRQCWQEVQRTKWAGYKISSYTYFRQWNYRIVEAEDGLRLFAFLKRGFYFKTLRSVDWRGWPRWKEYLRKGRKPKVIHFPREWRLHHGSCVGDETRMMTKLKNYGHNTSVNPEWMDQVWNKFTPQIRNFHYIPKRANKFESLLTLSSGEIPEEIKRCQWPKGWI